MSRLVDFYTDPDKMVLRSIERRYESQGSALPAFVTKRAMSESEVKALAPSEFACPEKRLFPVCSRADTWRSIAYFNVLKSAALSPASAREREGIRAMLAKAASLWGLDDAEVADLVQDVTLALPKKAESAPRPVADRIAAFDRAAPRMDDASRRAEADSILKAAAAEGEELDADARAMLLRRAGAATCTAATARRVVGRVLAELPFGSPQRDTLDKLHDSLFRMAASELLDPEDTAALVEHVERVAGHYHIKQAAADEMREFGADDAERILAEERDKVRLPGGIMARKSAVAENVKPIGIRLANDHGIEAYGVEDTLAALGRLAPVDLLPFRSLIGG